MGQMFGRTASFNQPLDAWNTANVESLFGIFRNSESFNQDIESWVTSAVTDMGEYQLEISPVAYPFVRTLSS